MKPKFIEAYLDTAERFSKLSSARRLQVGCVIVRDNRILSIGYNGMPAGWTNDCEYWFEDGDNGSGWRTKPEVIHAEANAIIKLARDGESGRNADLFITHAPCINCAKMIYGVGIQKVYYLNTYRDTAGIEFLNMCGIETKLYEKKDDI